MATLLFTSYKSYLGIIIILQNFADCDILKLHQFFRKQYETHLHWKYEFFNNRRKYQKSFFKIWRS